MKRIEWLWNLLYYNFYSFDIKISQLFNYINPFYWFNKISSVKKYHTKYDMDDKNEFAKKIFDNPKNGLSSIITGSFMGALLALIEYGIFNIIQMLVDKPLIQYVWIDSLHFIIYLILFMIPVILINNRLLFKKYKYLEYFEKFEKMTDREKTVYGWLSLTIVISILSFFVASFLLL